MSGRSPAPLIFHVFSATSHTPHTLFCILWKPKSWTKTGAVKRQLWNQRWGPKNLHGRICTLAAWPLGGYIMFVLPWRASSTRKPAAQVTFQQERYNRAFAKVHNLKLMQCSMSNRKVRGNNLARRTKLVWRFLHLPAMQLTWYEGVVGTVARASPRTKWKVTTRVHCSF